MKIAPQGYTYIGILFGIALLLSFFPPTRPLSALAFFLGLFIAFFFRDPERTPPEDPRLLVSPADGRVVYAGTDPEDKSGRVRISIFLSIFNVHINRAPLSATIDKVRYTPGSFLPAYKREASVQNEQNELELSDDSLKVTVRQIAGVVARRIICYKEKGDRLNRGERFGLIQFGSRVDVLLPPEVRVRVSVGDRLKGGQSILAEKP